MQGRPVSDFVLSLSLSSLVHLCVRVCVCVCVFHRLLSTILLARPPDADLGLCSRHAEQLRDLKKAFNRKYNRKE